MLSKQARAVGLAVGVKSELDFRQSLEKFPVLQLTSCFSFGAPLPVRGVTTPFTPEALQLAARLRERPWDLGQDPKTVVLKCE